MDGHTTFKIKTREVRTDRLVIGSSSRADLRLDDPIAAGAHCALSGTAERLRVTDLGTSTGTYVGGVRVPAGGVEVPLPCEIVLGASRIQVDRSGDKVTLQPRERSFYFQEPSRGENAADRTAWSFSELELGRMRFLTACNRAAVLASIAFCLLLFVPRFREPMVSPGSLTRGHASLACYDCHEPGQGTPFSKCSRCHGDLIANQHPFAEDHSRSPLAGVSSSFDSGTCNVCHLEHALHGEASWDSLNDELTRRSTERCLDCHESTIVGRRIQDSMATGPDGGAGAGSIVIERAIAPVPPGEERVFSTVAFGHADHVARDVDRDGTADVDIPCAWCHVPSTTPAAAMPRREFAPVPFETCAKCHVRGKEDRRGLESQWAAWEKLLEEAPDAATPAFVWNVRWHGTDDPDECHRCHEPIGQRGEWHRAPALVEGASAGIDRLARDAERAGLQRVDRRIRERGLFDPRRALYDAARRDHAEYFEKSKACTGCHVDGSVTPDQDPPPRPFLHFLHLSQDPVAANPAGRAAAEAECRACHFDRASSDGLTDLASGSAFHWDSPSACGRCHKDGDGNVLALSPAEAHAQAGPASERRSLPDFPHGPHVPRDGAAPHPRLANGCFTCHEFVASSDGVAAHAVVETIPAMRDCRTCHAQHDEVGGGACKRCHPQGRDEYHSFWGERPPDDRPFPKRPWPGFGGFDHFSRGHVAIASPSSEQPDCTKCHVTQELVASTTLATVPIPSEVQAVCRDCHVNLGTLRFHWR